MRSRGQRAQVLVFFALAMPLLLLPVAAYAAEAPMLAAYQARLAEAAGAAVLDAAQQIDVARLRSGGGMAVDPRAAAAIVTADLAAQEPGAAVDSLTVSGNQVKLAAHEWVPLRLATFVRGAGVTLRSSVSATLAAGYATPG